MRREKDVATRLGTMSVMQMQLKEPRTLRTVSEVGGCVDLIGSCQVVESRRRGYKWMRAASVLSISVVEERRRRRRVEVTRSGWKTHLHQHAFDRVGSGSEVSVFCK